jgi:ankyrin repeat protein
MLRALSLFQNALRPLHVAAQLGEEDVVDALIEAGADVDAQCKVRSTIVSI